MTEALLKHTDEIDPEYNNLKKCVDQISEIADEVNEKYVTLRFGICIIFDKILKYFFLTLKFEF